MVQSTSMLESINQVGKLLTVEAFWPHAHRGTSRLKFVIVTGSPMHICDSVLGGEDENPATPIQSSHTECLARMNAGSLSVTVY